MSKNKIKKYEEIHENENKGIKTEVFFFILIFIIVASLFTVIAVLANKNQDLEERVDVYERQLHVEGKYLQDCPICGRPAKLNDTFYNSYKIKCTGCYFSTPFCDTVEKAIYIWNRLSYNAEETVQEE